MIKSLEDAKLLNPLDLSFVSFNHKPRQYPRQSGVYFIAEGTKILYVGRALNLYSRLSNHSRRKQFSENNYSISWILVDKKVPDVVENFLISKFTPPINESPTGKDDDSWALHSLIADLGYDNPDLLNQREDDIKQSFLSMVQLFKDGSHPASYLIN